jgi:hypothetical protein
MIASALFNAVLICWSEFPRYDNSAAFSIVWIVAFLTLFALSHPDLTFFARYLLYFHYAELHFSVVRSNLPSFFLIALFFVVVASERYRDWLYFTFCVDFSLL